MQLFIQGSRIHALDVSEETLVCDVKEVLSSLEEVGCDDQVLYYGGLPLEDDIFVCEAVPESGTISLAVRLLGGVLYAFKLMPITLIFCVLGKVHGSLARAGKVRGQTPKVCEAGKLCS